MKDLKGKTFTKAFWKVVKDSVCKPNRKWVDIQQINEIMFKDQNIKIYSTYAIGKSEVTKRFLEH